MSNSSPTIKPKPKSKSKTNSPPKPKLKTGPKPIKHDEDLILNLATIGCTYQEIATFLKINPCTLTRRFQDIIQKGHAEMDISLRRKQIEVALSGDTRMLTWLGRTRLKQGEKYLVEHGGEVNHTVKVEFVNFQDGE